LDPVFKGHYPEDMLDHYKANLPGFSVVQDGDMDVIAQPLDFLGVNYYFPGTIMDSTRVKEARAAGYGVPIVSSFPTYGFSPWRRPARTLRRWDGKSTRRGSPSYSCG